MYKRIFILVVIIFLSPFVNAQSYAPQVGFDGATAIHKGHISIIDWANSVSIIRGYKDVLHAENGFVDYGNETSAIGVANTSIVSLGDGGEAIITFNHSIINEQGTDFVIFENGFLQASGSDMAFLELAFVEVSTDGIDYIRFPAISENQHVSQINSFGFIDARYIHNFAGKYIQDYGTPFDLEELTDLIIGTTVDLNNINYIKLIDVIGIIDTINSSFDSENNIVNDPYPTSFSSGGFDLNAVGVIHNSTTTATSTFTNNKFSIYPNPANKVLHVSSKSLNKIKIYSLQGEELISTNNNRINIEMLSKGIYFITLEANNKIVKTQFIKK